MAAPTEIDLQYTREDTHPIPFQMRNDSGDAVDISVGFTFTMTVNSLSDGDDASAVIQFTLTGVVTDGVNGVFQFTPGIGDADLDADVYFYDVQQDAPTRRTIASGKFEILTQVTLT